MNKIKMFLLAAILTVTAGSVSAQKSGYISLDQVVSLMPEIGKIDTALQRYQVDSLQPQLAIMIQDYNYKDSMLSSKDSTKIPVTVRNQYRQDMQNVSYQLQNWQGFSQQMMQAKQEQLLEPVYRKAMNALNTVAKEAGYSYVYNREVLLVAPPADDLLPLVAKKLGIKLPPATASTPK
jgi:outer membrane protein